MLPVDIAIRKATSDDYQGILNVMRPWNMHHVPSLEMPEIDVNSPDAIKIAVAVP